MQERQVTIGRQTYPAPDPFLVMATQNPIESEGTYQLPEAQVDRFMLKVLVGLPLSRGGVRRRRAACRAPAPRPSRCSTADSLRDYQRQADAGLRRPGDHRLCRPARRPRPGTRRSSGRADLARFLTYGASPRASINLVLAARALAFLRGRDYALPDDVRDLARDVLRHRIVLSYEALAEDLSADDLLTPILAAPHSRRSRAGEVCPRRPPERLTVDQAALADVPSALLRQLEWRVVRRLDGQLQGDYRSLFRGMRDRLHGPSRVRAR